MKISLDTRTLKDTNQRLAFNNKSRVYKTELYVLFNSFNRFDLWLFQAQGRFSKFWEEECAYLCGHS